jgi:hypothetical protein
MTGPVLATLCEEVNGGASIGSTLLFQLVNVAKALVEQRRPWMVLRSTDTSKTVAAGNTWQTAIDLSTIARFSRFHGKYPVRLFDGTNNVQRYYEVPMDERLTYKDAPGTFCYDESTGALYLNGTVPFAGTLHIRHLKYSPDIENIDASSWVFPSWSHPLLAFMAVGIHKGGIDYDDINARMSPENRALAIQIMNMLVNWDTEKQLSSIENEDPSNSGDGFRSGAINIHG